MRNVRRNRGSIFVLTMWVVIVLTGVTLVMANSMRVESLASANRLSEVQADAAERGAEQWLMSVVDKEVAQPGTAVQINMEARAVGGNYVWILKPDPDNVQQRTFGLTDEAGKLDLNTATAQMLQNLPDLANYQNVAPSIVNWRSTQAAGGALGATDTDYNALPEPYRCKHANFETTDELRLVIGCTPEVLWGYDKNRDGMLDANEAAAGGMASSFDSGNGGGRGIMPYVTVYGVRATNPSTTGGGGGGGGANALINVNAQDTQRLRTLLNNALGASRANQILQSTRNTTFRNVFDFAVRAALTPQEFSQIYPRITANPANGNAPRIGKVNINTASRAVLKALPQMEDSDVMQIINHRTAVSSTGVNLNDLSWLLEAIPRNKAVAIGSYITGTSTVFSGEILAISGDGRAFKRVRVVIDGSRNPSHIIYRRDLTSYGWPLEAGIRQALRSGQSLISNG